jgi:hypothetical protein
MNVLLIFKTLINILRRRKKNSHRLDPMLCTPGLFAVQSAPNIVLEKAGFIWSTGQSWKEG